MLILASQSQIRRHLLESAGITFSIEASPLDEREFHEQFIGGTPPELAQTLATAKATALSQLKKDAIVIGVDQTLSLGHQIFHKPTDLHQAREQLQQLRGKTHTLHSAYSLVCNGNIMVQHCQYAQLTMRNFTDAFLDAYLVEEEPAIMQSVGCYHVEGRGIQLMEHIDGDYFTILGLPLLPLLSHLRALGVIAK